MSSGSMAGGNAAPTSSAPETNSPSEDQGANTFGSLKGLFKQQYSKCKHCGKSFVPKVKMPSSGFTPNMPKI